MPANAKQAFLYLSKALGAFYFARKFAQPGLRILCYHGFAMHDEASFRPKLFISPKTFERRLRYLSTQRYSVLPLPESLQALAEGKLPPRAVVITIDDGFYSVYRCALTALRTFSFPACVYVTTYYCQKESPVFRLVVQYMFWKTTMRELDLSGLAVPGTSVVRLDDLATRERLLWDLILFGETQLTEQQRCTLARKIGSRLGVDYDSIAKQRILSLMTFQEIQHLAESGVDVQLHTHRHRLPEEESSVRREIAENRAILEPLALRSLEHLCYPSGIWSARMWPWLAEAGITSATTCEPGLNLATTSKLGLRRFLDGENISQIEFEAEMCGFNDVLRALRNAVATRPDAVGADPNTTFTPR